TEDLRQRGAATFFGRVRRADREHLARVVPLINRVRDVQSLIALQANQVGAEDRGQNLGDLGLADAGLAFEQQRLGQLQRQENRRREARVGDILLRPESLLNVFDGVQAGSLILNFVLY